MQNTVHIYGLIDPRTQELRYIGKTNKQPEKRLKEHLACREEGHRTSWIKNVLESGNVPDVFVIEDVPELEWQEAERFWINYFKYIGSDLTNISEGGYGGPIGPETRAKLSKALLGRKKSEATRIKLRENTSFHRPEIRTLGNIALTGRPMSDKTKEKIRQKSIGRTYSDETRKLWSEQRTGKKHKPESIEKMIDLATKRMRDPITGKYIRKKENNE